MHGVIAISSLEMKLLVGPFLQENTLFLSGYDLEGLLEDWVIEFMFLIKFMDGT